MGRTATNGLTKAEAELACRQALLPTYLLRSRRVLETGTSATGYQRFLGAGKVVQFHYSVICRKKGKDSS